MLLSSRWHVLAPFYDCSIEQRHRVYLTALVLLQKLAPIALIVANPWLCIVQCRFLVNASVEVEKRLRRQLLVC